MLQPQRWAFSLGISSCVQRVLSHSSATEERKVLQNLSRYKTTNKSKPPRRGQAVTSTVGATRPPRNLFMEQAGSASAGEPSAAPNEEGAARSKSTSFPEGTPTCLTSSPSERGAVLQELKQLVRGERLPPKRT